MARRWIALGRVAAGVVALAGLAALGQEPEPRRGPPPPERIATPDAVEIAESVRALLAQPFLSDEERRDLRVFHGVWTEEDLDTPARRALASLISGRLDDESLVDEGGPALDRAEAAWRRGEITTALGLLDAVGAEGGLRGARLRASALESAGRLDEAGRVVETALEGANAGGGAMGPAEAVELARLLMVRARVRPQDTPAGGDFQRINRLLASAREGGGRLHWPVLIAEAELLYSKGNGAEAQQAVAQALSLNPRAVDGWALLGQMAVDGFAFDRMERFADRIDEIAGPGSVAAGVIRARGAMRQTDADGAEEAIRAVRARFPMAREPRAIEAAVSALRYDWGRTDELLAAYDRDFPGAMEAWFEVGRVLAEARQYEESDRYLSEASRRAPLRAEPLAERGLMLIQAGRDAEAGAVLRRSVELDPFNKRAANSLVLVDELAEYERIETAHFVVRFKPGIDRIVAEEMVLHLEAMHRRVTGRDRAGIDHEPSVRTTIDIMPSARWFAARIAGVTRIHTMAASTGPCIAMESPRIGPGHSVGSYDWLRVLRHEYVHTVTLSRTRNRIPHWFTEAAAVHLEDGPRDFGTVRLLREAYEAGALFDLREINVAFVRPRRPTDRALAYAQGHWMYEFIVTRWGERAPLALMDLYATGRREESAMREVLGLEPSAFLEEFRRFAGEQLRAWGMLPKPGEPTIREILRAEAEGTAEARERVRQAARDRASGGGGPGPGEAGEAEEGRQPATMTREIARRWLEWYPDHADLLERLSRLELRESGNVATPAIASVLERYARARPVDPLPHQALARMHLSRAEGSRSGAIPHLLFLDAREQYSPVYAAELARLHAEAGDLAAAQASAERATIVSPFDAGLRELAATMALRAGDRASARRHIVALTMIEPDRALHRQRLEALDRQGGR